MMIFSRSLFLIGLVALLVVNGAEASCSCTCICANGATSSSCDDYNPDACSTFCSPSFVTQSSESCDCLAADTSLRKCEGNDVITSALAKDVQVGDWIRARNTQGESICSQVYYVFAHDTSSQGVAIRVASKDDGEDDMLLQVSLNHLVLLAGQHDDNDLFSGRQSVRAQDVQVGDVMIVSDHAGNHQEGIVTSATIENDLDLVNVLTWDPILEVGDHQDKAVLISAHSFGEWTYSAVFAPLHMMHYFFGTSGVAWMMPVVEWIDHAFMYCEDESISCARGSV